MNREEARKKATELVSQMTLDKVNTIIILNHSIFAEFIFTFNAHPILCQHPLDIAIVFLDILSDMVNPLLIDFPATVGIDFTARDLQRKFRKEGLPWELCKGFDSSAAIGDFVSKEELPDIQQIPFHLDIDGHTVQEGYSGDMLFAVDELIAYDSSFYTLKIGDLLFTGTPTGVGPVAVGQHLQGYIQGRKVLEFYER